MKMASSNSSNIDNLEPIHIHRQCSACNALFSCGEPVVAVVCNNKSVRLYNTYAWKYGPVGKTCLPAGVTICHTLGDHGRCDVADRSVSVHVDCLRLFAKTCSAKDKYRRLWMAGTRIYPWRDAVPLMLDPVYYAPAEIISSAAGFHKTLLPELAELVGGHIQVNHPFLRFCKVIELAQYLSLAEFGEAATYPLCEVLSWSRGTSPVLVEPGQAVDGRMRLTIDSRGIRSIDMVPNDVEESTFIDCSLFSHAYIIEPMENLAGVCVEFQLGMSRLHLPKYEKLYMWTITSPYHSSHFGRDIASDELLSGRFEPKRFASLHLDPSQTTGISFFLLGNTICAIHGHSERGSQALPAFQYMRNSRKLSIDWIYVPIAANDKVISIGTVRTKNRPTRRLVSRRVCPIVISYSIVLTLKSGKYVIGRSRSRNFHRSEATELLYKLPQSEDRRHLTLIHNTAIRSRVMFIGADTVGETVSDIESSIKDSNGENTSYASLEAVVYAQVFSNQENGRCTGILLEYEDGIKRALGQCRLGFDDVRCYEHPRKFCYMPISIPREDPLSFSPPYSQVHAAFDSGTGLPAEEDPAKWEICPMKGILQFRFDAKETVLKILKSRDE